MNKECGVVIEETQDFGTVLRCFDLAVADQLEDFLTESGFILFKVKLQPEGMSFFFGQASSVEKVRSLYESFACQR